MIRITDRAGTWIGTSIVQAHKFSMKTLDKLSLYECAALGAAMDCFTTFYTCPRRHEIMVAEFSCKMSESLFMPIFYISIGARASLLFLKAIGMRRLPT